MTDMKMRARRQVRDALGRGILTRPVCCPRCGEADRQGKDGRSTIHAHHHKGYDRPLDIEWLCVRCHFQEDRRPARAANGRAKLSEVAVCEIRSRYRPDAKWWAAEGGAKQLARVYGVSDRTIRRIVRGEIWPDAALPSPDQKS